MDMGSPHEDQLQLYYFEEVKQQQNNSSKQGVNADTQVMSRS